MSPIENPKATAMSGTLFLLAQRWPSSPALLSSRSSSTDVAISMMSTRVVSQTGQDDDDGWALARLD